MMSEHQERLKRLREKVKNSTPREREEFVKRLMKWLDEDDDSPTLCEEQLEAMDRAIAAGELPPDAAEVQP